MKQVIFHTIVGALFMLSAAGVFAQMHGQARIDSLLIALSGAKEDTGKVNTLNSLCMEFQNVGNYQKAESYVSDALFLSKKIQFKKGEGNAYHNTGRLLWLQGKYQEALKNFQSGMEIRVEIGDKAGIASSYNSIGAFYYSLGNYTEAMKNYFASLKIKEEIRDKRGIAYTYNNIGIVYYEQRNYPEALKNYFAALKPLEEIGDKRGIATAYNNIGSIFNEQKNYPEALKNYLKAVEIQEQIGNKTGIANSYNSIGNIYNDQGNYPEALKNYIVALKILEEIGEKTGIATAYINLGDINIKLKKFNEAKKYLNDALSLSKNLNIIPQITESFHKLSTLDSATGNFRSALENYKLYISFNDSLVNEENTKKITQQQMQYEFDKKEELASAEQEKKDSLQRIIRYSMAAGLGGAMFFIFIVYRQRNKISKEKKRSDELLVKSDNLLLNILPYEVAEEIKREGHSKAKTFSMVTVMFTDFKGFTAVSEKVSAELLVAEIDYCFSAFDNIVQKYGVEKIKTIGDSYMCAGGMPVLNFTHAVDIISAAIEMRNFMLVRKQEKEAKGEIPFDMRLGIHTGPVVAGIVGLRKYVYDIWGDTVNVAARMESNSEAGKINISGSTYELVKNKFNCIHRGKIEAKNKGMIDMYFVES